MPTSHRTECEWTLCDSCNSFFDEDGNLTSEQPHRADINTTAGTCPQCELTLTRLGVPIVSNLSGGVVTPNTCGLNKSVDDNAPSDSASMGFNESKPVQFRPTAQFNFQNAA